MMNDRTINIRDTRVLLIPMSAGAFAMGGTSCDSTNDQVSASATPKTVTAAAVVPATTGNATVTAPAPIPNEHHAEPIKVPSSANAKEASSQESTMSFGVIEASATWPCHGGRGQPKAPNQLPCADRPDR